MYSAKSFRSTASTFLLLAHVEFFDLLKDRRPHMQSYAVIFDSFYDFVEYAITDGVPGWMVAGYFSPEAKVLYLFNVLGDEMSEILFEALVGESGRQIDDHQIQLSQRCLEQTKPVALDRHDVVPTAVCGNELVDTVRVAHAHAQLWHQRRRERRFQRIAHHDDHGDLDIRLGEKPLPCVLRCSKQCREYLYLITLAGSINLGIGGGREPARRRRMDLDSQAGATAAVDRVRRPRVPGRDRRSHPEEGPPRLIASGNQLW